MKNFSIKDKELVVFDLDGTIVDLTVDWISLKDFLVKKYEEIYQESCDFKSVSRCLEKIVEKKDENTIQNFFDIIRHYELKNIKDVKIIDETIFFINNKNLFEVKNEIKFAIFSLNTRETIIRALKIAGINDKIDLIIGREDVRKWKPNPEGLLTILNHFKIKKEEVIYFGDMEKDLLTGENAGIEVHLIDELINLVKKKKFTEK